MLQADVLFFVFLAAQQFLLFQNSESNHLLITLHTIISHSLLFENSSLPPSRVLLQIDSIYKWCTYKVVTNDSAILQNCFDRNIIFLLHRSQVDEQNASVSI